MVGLAVYMCLLRVFFFFFSSRRRHTRCSRDWSSDVCSSDLEPVAVHDAGRAHRLAAAAPETAVEMEGEEPVLGPELARLEGAHQLDAAARAVRFVAGGEERGAGLEAEAAGRSEERRVGEESQ